MQRIANFLSLVLVCAVAMSSVQAFATGRRATIAPVSLTCEYEPSPLLDIQNPRLSWVNENSRHLKGAAQTAYRIRVAQSADGFDAPLWDTGKVASSASAFITYAGPALRSRTTYW